jgi:hypothetical protein
MVTEWRILSQNNSWKSRIICGKIADLLLNWVPLRGFFPAPNDGAIVLFGPLPWKIASLRSNNRGW